MGKNRPPKNEKRPVYPNECEEKCAAELEAQGYRVTKRGWPDLICWRGGKKGERGVIFVEVKPTREPLRRSQAYVMNVLEEAGFACFRWDPKDGLRRYDRDDQVAREKRVNMARSIKRGVWPNGHPIWPKKRAELISEGAPVQLTAWERETRRSTENP